MHGIGCLKYIRLWRGLVPDGELVDDILAGENNWREFHAQIHLQTTCFFKTFL